jgi:hypothetical protein
METYAQTVAQELLRLGHQASIFTPNAGTMAELTREKGIAVLGRADLPAGCDAILAQDASTCHELAVRYPEVVRVMVAHSRDHVLQEAPQLPEVCHGVVVLNDRVGRWMGARAWHPPLTRLRQPITLSRYSDLKAPRPRPRRVLVSSNYVAGPRGKLIEEACRQAGFETAWMGMTSEPSATPERELANADIVVGLGRCAIEGMAAGRAVYIYGVLGGGGWVTPRSYWQMEADGFAGLTDVRPTTVERMASDLRAWRGDMGEANRDLVSANHSARTHAVELVELVRRLDEQRSSAGSTAAGRATQRDRSRQMPTAAEEIARLLRLEWQAYMRGMRAILEANTLRSEHEPREASLRDALSRVATLDRELEGARARIATLEEHLVQARDRMAKQDAQLRALHSTRRYRLAGVMAAPFDALRARLR